MNYFSAYWQQVKAFYRVMWINLFVRERELDGELTNFVLKQGFFWDWIQVHGWVLKAIWLVIRNTFQLAFCYFAAVIILGILLFAPLLIICVFPIFAFNRYRRVKREAASL